MISAQLKKRALRLGILKAFNLHTAEKLQALRYSEAREWSAKLMGCGTWVLVREYLSSGDTRVKGGNWCKKHLLCPLCASARAKRNVQTYGAKLSALGGKQYMVTLTWPSPVGRDLASLRASIELGLCAFRKLWNRRKVAIARKMREAGGPLRNVAAVLLALEVAYTEAHGWHPHLHGVLVVPSGSPRVDARELREEWALLTGGNQIELSHLKSEADLLEVLKYTSKPGALPGEESYAVQLVLGGRRTIFTFGDLRAVPEDDYAELDPESGEDYIDWLLQWAGRHYDVSRHEAGQELRR
jgi:hypothetical protein